MDEMILYLLINVLLWQLDS